MKKYSAFILFALTAIAGSAQSKYQDVAYQENRSIIRGVIAGEDPKKSVKMGAAEDKDPVMGSSVNASGKRSWYEGIVEAGYEIGVGDFGISRLKLNMINDYRISPYFSLGIGTGLRYYFKEKAALIPLFADFRSNFTDHKIAPYASLGIGYTLDATNGFAGVGFFLNPTTGVSFGIPNGSAIIVGLGYAMQKMKFLYLGGPYNAVYTKNSGAISLNAGISF
jgi:hypothetical protein